MATGTKNRDGEAPSGGDKKAWFHWGDGFAGHVVAARLQVYDPDTLAWRAATEDDFGGEAGGAAGGGVEYTEGDTDASITGKAILWEDSGNTLRPVSAVKPLPIEITNAEAVATTVTVLQGGQVGWIPEYNDLVAATGDPSLTTNNGGSFDPGFLYVRKLRVPNSITVSQIAIIVAQFADPDAAVGIYFGIYDSSGVLINETAELSDEVEDDTDAHKLFDLDTAPFVITGGPDVFVWMAMLAGEEGGNFKPQTFAEASDGIGGLAANAFLAPEELNLARLGDAGVDLTLPASFDPAELVDEIASYSIPNFWVGLA